MFLKLRGFSGVGADFGPSFTPHAIIGNVFIPFDPHGCIPFTLPPTPNDVTETDGFAMVWIPLIIRGACDFDTKVFNAQIAGAPAAMIYDDYINGTTAGVMQPAHNGLVITIHSMLLSNVDGVDIVASVASSLYPVAAFFQAEGEHATRICIILIVCVFVCLSIPCCI